MLTRRQLIASTGSLALFASLRAETTYPLPDPSLFQSGDFVWPKKPGAYVPYKSDAPSSPVNDEITWNRERDSYISRLKAKQVLDEVDREQIKVLPKLTFREFLAIYEGNEPPERPSGFSGSGFYVGHVGIVDVDPDGKPWVVEALVKPGVRRISYDDWLKGRPGEMVWLGRLRGFSAADRQLVVQDARTHIGKPYNFWNFDLGDTSGFYCSKLAWHSIFGALHFPVDGRADPKRALWFSPKQLLYISAMDRIHDPGPYAYK